ncbi:MAG TPA: HD domain-containing protein [Steroidobacteraceae bacterium]|nr:HD domain-containing protein [Steroidobacteraceae bacterium]
MSDASTIADEVEALFRARGAGAYYGEPVTMTEHMLQSAQEAALSGATPALVLAALLHDIGHLVEPVPDDLADWLEDAHHEEIGARWLAERFGPEIVEPVRLHVPAKRYLCAVDPAYFARLSEASVYTLKLQGGPMSAEEVRRFESAPHYREAVRVRRCDDAGKRSAAPTPGLAHYRSLIEAHARPRAPAR